MERDASQQGVGTKAFGQGTNARERPVVTSLNGIVPNDFADVGNPPILSR